MSKELNNARAYAKYHATLLQSAYPDYFTDSFGINKAVIFANALGIDVSRTERPIKGRLEITKTGVTIKVNPLLNKHYIVNTIFHEIGHWYLFKNHPEFEKNQAVDWKEEYANCFAEEICVPLQLRAQVARVLANCDDVTEAIKIANHFRVSISTLFRIISTDSLQCNIDHDHIWIVAKPKLNEHTKIEEKLRVRATFHNWERFYIPWNQSIESLMETKWLNNLLLGVVKNAELSIKIDFRMIGFKPEYKRQFVEATCSAIRLNPYLNESTSQILFLFRIKNYCRLP